MKIQLLRNNSIVSGYKNTNHLTNGIKIQKNATTDTFSFQSRLVSNEKLDAYVLNPNFKPMSHEDFLKSDYYKKDNSFMPNSKSFWRQYWSTSGDKCAWKIHLYSNNEKDWQRMYVLLEPYLTDNDLKWKTLGNEKESFEKLNSAEQKGKAFTIYPHCKSEFAKIVHDINYIIKKNHMCVRFSKIQGDRPLGDSGRIFYRYEYSKKEYSDCILSMNSKRAYRIYQSIYEGNRKGGRYLATDMTCDDDPWLKFNPDINDENFIA